VFVSDTGNHRIQKFKTDGTFLTKWGPEGSDDGQFSIAHGLAIKSAEVTFLQERVFVADAGNNCIQVFKRGTAVEG
jgi:DNA-binding beta-propeller fold protein YncE